MPDCFEFRAKHFEQELLGFRQPNLIQCLSEGQVDRKIYCSLTLGLRARAFHILLVLLKNNL